MKLSDILRDFAELLDQQADQYNDPNRIAQMRDLTAKTNTPDEFSNAPDEQYADVSAVTTNAGGGMHAPKDPADLRGNSQSLYPAAQWRGK